MNDIGNEAQRLSNSIKTSRILVNRFRNLGNIIDFGKDVVTLYEDSKNSQIEQFNLDKS